MAAAASDDEHRHPGCCDAVHPDEVAVYSREGAGHDACVEDEHVYVLSCLEVLLCKGLDVLEVCEVQLAHLDAALELSSLPAADAVGAPLR